MPNPARKSPGLHWRWLLPMVALGLIFHLSFLGRSLDWAFFDAASRHPLRAPPLPKNSALVLVDEKTMDVLGRDPYAQRWPFERSYFAALIAALDRAGAERIVVDLLFIDHGEAMQDAQLGALAAASPKVALARTPKQPPAFWDDAFVQEHTSFFPHPRTGFVELASPEDEGSLVTRGYTATGSLAAAALGPSTPVRGGLIRWHGSIKQVEALDVPLISAAHFIVAGLPVLERLTAKSPNLTPEEFAAALAAEPALSSDSPVVSKVIEQVKGRVVFVGASANATFDLKTFPVGTLEPGTLLPWTAWTNLSTDGFIQPVSRWLALGAATLAVMALLGIAGRQTGLAVPVAVTTGFVALLSLGAHAALSAGWFFPPATPSVAAVLTLLGVAVEKFWNEQARKREIQAMFGAYVDPNVVAQLVRDPDSIRLGGERREATAFFSDLAGFTDLSEKLKDQPELMVEIVNTYLEETTEVLLNHGAYVDKYIGDAVMGVFGAPLAQADHAVAACRAALDAQKLIKGINARYEAGSGVRLAVRIGINTGEMIVGNLGSSRKKNYTVMGDAVNLASRLEAANKAFHTGILIGDETARRVQGALVTRPLARLRVKGKLEAIEVHTVHGAEEALSAEEKDFVASYREGYTAYVNRKFAEAVIALNRADGIMPGDLTTQRLRDESALYSQTPPPPGWEPILTLESK